MDPWKRKGHGLLGFHPNHVHYISMLMVHEMATSELVCVCLCVAENTSVYTLSKFSKILWCFVIPFEAFTLLVLGPQTPQEPNSSKRYVISSNFLC